MAGDRGAVAATSTPTSKTASTRAATTNSDSLLLHQRYNNHDYHERQQQYRHSNGTKALSDEENGDDGDDGIDVVGDVSDVGSEFIRSRMVDSLSECNSNGVTRSQLLRGNSSRIITSLNTTGTSVSMDGQDETDGATVVDGICRYAAGSSNGAMSFVEVCQIRLQQLFPQILPPQRSISNSLLCDDSIELTAEHLANDVIRFLLKEDIYLISRDPISRSMRHNVYQMLNKHSILFTSMVNRLNVHPNTAYDAFMGVADELFYQGITWARIVCLYAFMGRLALWARDRRMHTLRQKLPLYVARYIGEEIVQFIKVCGGWEQLCIEYPVAEEMSGAVWRSLLMTGATLGLVATILSVTA